MASYDDANGENRIAVWFLYIHTINCPVYTFTSRISKNTYG